MKKIIADIGDLYIVCFGLYTTLETIEMVEDYYVWTKVIYGFGDAAGYEGHEFSYYQTDFYNPSKFKKVKSIEIYKELFL